jgi:glyoxylase-like metal-dependent hydrolase (beta-lactamase superfamily II)
MSELRVHALSTGRVRPKRAQRGVRRYLPGGWSDRTLPVNVIAVEHPDGVCLFDAGQTSAAARPGHFPRWYPFFWLSRFELERDDEADARLTAIGMAPGSVRWLVLSHLHTDHAGGVPRFAGAEVLVSRLEWERAQGLGGRLRGYLPQHWPAGIRPRVVEFDGPPLGPFAASHDLAGDGALVLVPTPGHTPGHMAMVVRDGDRAWLCAGDLAHDAQDMQRVAPEIARWCRQEHVTVLATHDEEALAA